MDSQDSSWPGLGEGNIFPLIVYSVLGHEISTQMSFCLGFPNGSPKIFTIGILVTLGPITLFTNLRLK
jgi:hypothetical protein